MDLTIRHMHQSPDRFSPAPSLTNCFVSLPTAVAASLWKITPQASLTILSVRRKRVEHAPVVVAWTGDTLQQVDALGFHPLFGDAIGLDDGEPVEVVVTERVVDNAPSAKVISATLRPVSYPRDGSKADADVSDEQVSLAREQYRCLNDIADILEDSILPQIRVVYNGLRFPVSIPGKDRIDVEVTHTKLSSDASSGRYGVLMPGSELLIEPPPPPPGSLDDAPKVREQFRVISFSDALRNIPYELLLTHAVLPDICSTGVAERAAHVSRRPSRDGDYILPAAFVCRDAVPAKHVWLPPFIWQDLLLEPLDTVFVEEVPMFAEPLDAVNIAKGDVHSDYPSFDALCRAHGVIYNGLRLRNGKLTVDDAIGAKPRMRYATMNEMIASGGSSLSNVIAGLDSTSKGLTAKLKVFPGFRIRERDSIAVSETNEEFGAHQKNDFEAMCNPMTDEILRTRLAEGLTRLSRTVVHESVAWARLVLSKKDGSDKNPISNVLLISGPEGSGKTLVCKTIAAILRSVGLLRTMWLQCSTTAEKHDALQKKLQVAYGRAADGGPGVVILDDIDFWVGGRRPHDGKGREDSIKGSGDDGYAYEILYRMKSTRKNPTLSIITCRDPKELDECFRAPGILGYKFSLELPGREDISILRRAVSLETSRELDGKIDTTQSISEPTYEQPQASLEGYNAKEIQLLFSRAMNQVEPKSETPRDQQVMQHLEKIVSEMGPGGMKKGARARKKEVPWIWKRIGGANVAKKALTEVLLWPSRRHELFQGAPLSLPRGILLYGPPGCGKTMLAKAAAHESKMRCIIVKGPELMSKYIGESEAEVRRAFERASRLRPCVLLFDEFDSLAPRRGSGTGVTDRIVNTLLTCMDGAERLSQGVYLLATSSRPELLDPAVLRPGRIDRWVPVEVPASAEERYDILRRLSEDFFKWSDPLDTALRNVSQYTGEYTGADLGGILNDARINIRKMEREKKIGSDEVVEAIGEALKESHPSLSYAERARFREVMASFGRAPGKSKKLLPSSPRVALR